MNSGTADRLRLWPGVALVLLQWGVRFGWPLVDPDAGPFAMLGGMVLWLGVILWWGFFSRAPRGTRAIGAVLLLVVPIASRWAFHPSFATAGMGILNLIYLVPVLCLAFVVWAAIAGRRAGGVRVGGMFAVILLACLPWALTRIDGVSTLGHTEFAWRWTPTAEERLLAEGSDRAAPEPEDGSEPEVAPATEADAVAEWPGFRGPLRDSRISGVRIETNWEASPPVEMWRRAVGPGWSSFAVQGDLVYTQEQRGEEELVSCYRIDTGRPVWQHADATRFWEANAGAGPRATPTLDRGRVYALGANGSLNALDARDGSRIWNRDIVADTGVATPEWGFSASPLVVGDVVVVAAVGKLAAYDRDTGEPRWQGPEGGDGYSSPHLLTLGGIEQIVLLSKTGAASVRPADGTVLWQYDWAAKSRIVQPALLPGGDLLMSRGETTGLRRVGIAKDGDAWSMEERWMTKRLKPYFSDFVIHEGHAYGIDGNIAAAIDLETGDRKWKGGRYGGGQVLLLRDQSLLLVLAEKGDLILVSATPDEFREIARVPVLEGKTWNHPVVVGDVLLVRNSEEMAAFRLPLEGRSE